MSATRQGEASFSRVGVDSQPSPFDFALLIRYSYSHLSEPGNWNVVDTQTGKTAEQRSR